MATREFRRRVLGLYGLGSTDPGPDDVARAMVWEAVLAGSRVELVRRASWWIVAADRDWLAQFGTGPEVEAPRPLSGDQPHGLLVESALHLFEVDAVFFRREEEELVVEGRPAVQVSADQVRRFVPEFAVRAVAVRARE